MRKSHFVLAGACALYCQPVQAQSSNDAAIDRYEQGNWAVGVAISTMGIGPELSWRLHPNLVLRGTGGFGGDASDLAKNISVATSNGSFGQSSDTKYELSKLTVQGARLLIDWHPFRDGGRLTVGAGYLDLAGEGSIKVSDAGGSYKIGDGTYTPTQVKGLSFTFANTEQVMGYAGLGFDNAFFKEYGFSLSSDFGVLWGFANDIKLTGGKISDADRVKEQGSLKAKFDKLPVYPVISLSAKYRF